MRKTFLTSAILFFLQAACLPAFADRIPLEELSNDLRNRLEAAETPILLAAAGEPVLASRELPRFYEARGYAIAWLTPRGLSANAKELVAALSRAQDEGLDPEDYHFSSIGHLIPGVRKARESGSPDGKRLLVDLDLLLTDSFLLYSSHLLAGCVNPTTIDPEWHANPREADLGQVLSRALEEGLVAESLEGLLPLQEGYGRLKTAYRQFRELEASGHETRVDGGGALRKGQTDARIGQVRLRLLQLGYPASEKGDPDPGEDLFDENLEETLRSFQARHGLPATGIIGPRTMAALNVPAAERAAQIQVNLERWRWLPQDLGERHVLVNIANFDLEAVESGQAVLTMRAIVGKHYRRTPVFSDRISYVVLNPYWHVPDKIAVEDILPILREDPAYLSQKKIRVFRGWGKNSQEVDPASISWKDVPAEKFPFRFRQDPGPLNALGKVKFMFPNDFGIYLHDTSSPELFSRDLPRTFSSGCIRVEKPMELLSYLTRGNSDLSERKIGELLEKGQEATVRLKMAVPVHLLYWTAWADPDGGVQFRDDIYERDEKLLAAIRKRPPSL